MEFLVRLTDKTNNQVFCLNPSHRDLKMGRFFFNDETFKAVCPNCNSDMWLYRKNNAISKKGHFITFKNNFWSWGTNELKHYGIVKIDCTYEQAKLWCETIEDEQARANVKKYIVEKDEAKLILAENQVNIAHRHRKLAFDFEQVLTVVQLKNWNDQVKYSEIVTISEQDKTQIKEAIYAINIG